MDNVIEQILNWSEVWSLIIPLVIILIYRPAGKETKPLVLYVIIALLINSIAFIIAEFNDAMPSWLKNNNIYYNLHSIARVVFFSWYIITIRQYRFVVVLRFLLVAYFAFVIINFALWEDFLVISSRLFAAESIVLLFLCISYFLRSIQDDSEVNWLRHPSFLVCMGVSLYEATSFFIFLFFWPLFEKNPEFGDLTMTIHNVMYIILCLMVALALYRAKKIYITTINKPN